VLVEQHQAAAFRLAYLLLGDADEAADVAQEAFIRAYRALDRFDATRPFRPWLMRIVVNLAHNLRRATSRYLASLQRLIRADPDSIGETAKGRRSEPGGEESQILWQAVRRLKPMDQQVIYLRYFLEFSEAETAETLKIAPGTVKSRTHRALNHLRVVVEREFPMLRESLAND
jgi:RNA polymerase sigma-70 factor (ECF subfamily)